jgi:adenosylcobinamide-GDP ribazoletransferase
LISALPRLRPCLVAFRFLTRLPLPVAGDASPLAASPSVLGRSALCYPLVGLCLGAALVLMWLGMAGLPGEAANLAVAAVLLGLWVWITGGLHLDGLADCADAWVGGLGSRERTLQILKDPLTGSMGVVALVLILLAKFAALASLPFSAAGALTLLLIPAVARAQLLALPLTTASARPDGLGAALREGLPRSAARRLLILVGALTALLFALTGRWLLGLVLLALAAILLIAWRRSVLERLGGFTGDTAGALVELTEAVLLLVAVLLIAD